MTILKQSARGGLLLLLGAALLLSSVNAQSQTSLENALKQYNGDAVKGYIQPVADLFGANMHSGFYHSAQMSRTGFHLSFDIVAMAAMVGDDQKTYEASAPAGFTPAKFMTATVFGEKGSEITHATIAGLKYKGSDGIFNTKAFPLAVPQLSIGYVYGTEAIVRFLPVPKIGDDKIPQITLWGVGLRHSISQYMPKVPVDLAAGFFYHSFKAGDLINYKGLSFGAQASKTWSILTLYTGLSYEKSSLNLTYNSTDVTVPVNVDVELDGANKFRFTGGICLTLGFLKLFADANLGAVTAFSGGIGFGN
jgi:hypothetical protein